MPYNDLMIQHFAEEAEKSRASAAPSVGAAGHDNSMAQQFADGAGASSGANDASASRIATTPYAVPQTNVDDLNGFQKMLLIRRPDVAALFGIRNPDRDRQRYAQERSDLAQMLGEYSDGLRSQMTRDGVFDQFADDRTRKALMGSQEWQDMVMFRAALDKSGKALEELSEGRTFQPNVQSLMTLARSLGYNLTMDDGGKIYLEDGDGRQMELTNENIKMLGDEAMQRFNSRVEKLKGYDSNYSSLTVDGNGLDTGRDMLVGAGSNYNDATDLMTKFSANAASTDRGSYDRFNLYSTWNKYSKQFPDLENILMEGRSGGLPPNMQVLMPNIVETLSRNGVQVDTSTGRLEFVVPTDGTFGMKSGRYGMKDFFARMEEADNADENGYGAQLRRYVAQVKDDVANRKATQELAARFEEEARQAQRAKWAELNAAAASGSQGQDASGDAGQGQNQEWTPTSPVTKDEATYMVAQFGNIAGIMPEKDQIQMRNMLAQANAMAQYYGMNDLDEIDFSDIENVKKLQELDNATSGFYNIIKDIIKRNKGNVKNFKNPIHEKLVDVLNKLGDQYETSMTEEEISAMRKAGKAPENPVVPPEFVYGMVAPELGAYAAAVHEGDTMEQRNAADARNKYNRMKNNKKHNAEQIRKGNLAPLSERDIKALNLMGH